MGGTRQRDQRFIQGLIEQVDARDPEQAMAVDAALLALGWRALPRLLRAARRNPPRYAELLAELVAGAAPWVVIRAFERFFATHLAVAVEGAWLLRDARLLPAALRAVGAFPVTGDPGLFAHLCELIESFGVSAGPVALDKARRLGIRPASPGRVHCERPA